MRKRAAYILLALMTLTQSVASLALALPSPAHTETPDELSLEMQGFSAAEMSHPDPLAPCHKESSPAADHVPGSCCEFMEESSCLNFCTAAGAAIGDAPTPQSTVIHERFSLDSSHAAPRKLMAGLYRPPRSR